jgi:hypothetical protein
MAQHDYNIANQSGAAFRQDLNNALEAIVSQNSGTAEPSVTYAYQWWADTTAGVLKQRNAANSAWITIRELDGDLVIPAGAEATPSLYFTGDINTGVFSPGADEVAVATGGVSRLVVNASGQAVLGAGTVGAPVITTTGDTNTGIYFPAEDTIGFAEGGVEAARIDSSGRLLIGTSSARANFFNATASAGIQLESSGDPNTINRRASLVHGNTDAFGPYFILGKHRSSSIGGTTVVQSGDETGGITFQGSDGTEFVESARIQAFVDGTPGANDMPGRLVFFTTADGASSPTERMRILNNGHVLTGKTVDDATSGGLTAQTASNDQLFRIVNTSPSGGEPLIVNRQASDGTLVSFRQANIVEGAISVSGTTVTYGGGHLARWSQLQNEEDPSSILKGTVISNLDEMCEWGEENNEQLNKTKISDVEGDPNVAGVFVSTSFSEDGPLDFFVAMTGDMIIRIAEGVTVQRGDLLMSAGDGTAKPQDDDIIRSKTVAKVTSSHVTCTYEDGSYCVPCVLMAC